MSSPRLEVIERDEAGNVKATYIETETRAGKGSRRIDCVVRGYSAVPRTDCFESSIKINCADSCSKVPKNPYGGWTSLLNVFLPAGYPNSVTKDYLEFETLYILYHPGCLDRMKFF
jgi:hypothetical protein